MKLVVIFMAILNIIFFSWQLLKSDDPAPTIKSSSKNSRYKTITLLHESPQLNFSSSKPTPTATSVSATKQSTKQSTRQNSRQSARRTTRQVPIPIPPEKKSISSRLGEAREEKEKLAKNEIISCFKLGPYSVKLNAENSLSRTKGYGAVGNLYAEEKRERFRYWVLVPMRNKQAALKRIKKFKEKGIDDVYLIREGKKKDNISLGIFRERSIAKKRIQQLQELGFNPVVEKHYKVRSEYWLTIKETVRGPLSAKAWKDIIGDLDGIKKSEESC